MDGLKVGDELWCTGSHPSRSRVSALEAWDARGAERSHPTEALAGGIGRDGDHMDAEVAADDVGDVAGAYALLGDGVEYGAGCAVLEREVEAAASSRCTAGQRSEPSPTYDEVPCFGRGR